MPMKRASTRRKPGARKGVPDGRINASAARALRSERDAAVAAKAAAQAELQREKAARAKAEQKTRDVQLSLEQTKAELSAQIVYRKYAERELATYRGR